MFFTNYEYIFVYIGAGQIFMKRSRECLSDKQIREAFRLWCSGVKILDIADKYYVCEQTLYRAFKRRKLHKPRSRK